MARNLQVALTLLAKDAASKVLRKVMQDSIRQQQEAGKASDQLGNTQKRNSDSSIRASRSLQAEFRRAASARESLGIRSEKTIQREIQLTIAAYGRLTRTGKLSASEQGRAFQAMTERVSRLRTELTGAGQAMSKMDRARQWGSNFGAVAGGVMAAGAVLSNPISNQVEYQDRLAGMTNTAFGDRDLAGRFSGMKDIDSLIRQSVRTGGGTKETAAETLDNLLASGQVDMESAKTMLPVLQKYATATGTSAVDLGNIAIRLKQSFGLKDADLDSALNMAISAGQAGSFELKDMAKWLPKQLAAGSNMGMKGLDDFSTLLGWNQTSAITAGTKDEAGNNLNQLLLKINSVDAANAAKKIIIDGKGIDLTGSLVKARGKGTNSLDAFNGIVDRIVSSNSQYKSLESKLKKAPDSERQGIMESQLKILEGSSIGKMIADQQALLALIAYRGNKDYAKEVISGANAERELPQGKRAGDLNFEFMSQQAKYKFNSINNEKDFAELDSTKPLTEALADAAAKLTDYAKEYPELTTALSVATTAIKTMTVAATAFATLRFLTGAGGIRVPGAAAGAAAAAGSASSGIGGRLASGFGRLAGRIAAPLALWQAAEDAPLLKVQRGDAEARKRLEQGNYTSSLDRLKDADAARPGLKDAWDEVKSWWSPPTSIGKELQPGFGSPSYLTPPQQQSQPFQQPFIITNKIELDGQQIAESVNTVNSQQSVRGPTGGPH